MAKLIRKAGSPYWVARVVHRGVDHSWSTGQKGKKAAQQWMENKLREMRGQVTVDEAVNSLLLALAGLPEQAAAEKRMEIARLVAGAGADRKLRLNAAWEAFTLCPQKKAQESKGTLRNYESHWTAFVKWATGRKLEYLHEVTPTLAEEYAAKLWSMKLSGATYNQHLQFLRRLFALLADRAGVLFDPFAKIVRKEARPESRRAFTTAELRTICRAARGEMRVLVGLGLFTGLRLGDACRLTWGNVDLVRGMIDLVPSKTKRKGKTLSIPIHPALRALLQEAGERGQRQADAFVLPSMAADYNRDRRAPAINFGNFLTSLGMVTTEAIPAGVRRVRQVARAGFHSLRHSFASLMANAGAPQVALVDLLGHGSPAVTALYSHAGDESKAAAVKLLPDYFKKGGQA